MDFPILSLLLFSPLVGVLFLYLIKGDAETINRNARHTALFTSVFVLAVSLLLLMGFDSNEAGFQFVENRTWMPSLGLAYHLGVDGISLFFVVLSAFLTPVCILASWSSIKTRVREYMIAFLVLETFMMGTFLALDSFLFYVFFEGVLIPMFLIIGIWGGPRRVYSAFKFILYTLLGSVLMFLALLTLYFQVGTSSIPELIANPVARNIQMWLWIACFASFAIKMPMWPFHTWLPDAHVEAPTAGSMILAGVLLKMGGYGFLRFSIPMFPEATEYFVPFIYTLSVIAIIYASLVALVQEDMKKLIAYSSVAHMGFVTLGIFSMTMEGLQGGMFQMISHGLISAALFLCVGVLYDRLHTRDMGRYGGIVQNMPRYATVFMILMLGAVGLPGTSGFIGEFLALLGVFQANILVAILATTGIVLGAAYMLRLYRVVVFGRVTNKDAGEMSDMNQRESAILISIVLMVLALGIAPNLILDRTSASLQALQTHYESHIQSAHQHGVLIKEKISTDIGTDYHE